MSLQIHLGFGFIRASPAPQLRRQGLFVEDSLRTFVWLVPGASPAPQTGLDRESLGCMPCLQALQADAGCQSVLFCCWADIAL